MAGHESQIGNTVLGFSWNDLSKTIRNIWLVVVPPVIQTWHFDFKKIIGLITWTSFICIPVVELWYSHPSLCAGSYFAVSHIRSVAPRNNNALLGVPQWIEASTSFDNSKRTSCHTAWCWRRWRKNGIISHYNVSANKKKYLKIVKVFSLGGRDGGSIIRGSFLFCRSSWNLTPVHIEK